ncbi:MAG TPA: 6-phosphogluconolactonase [Pyrinomonadaceae bacterium]|nr:6-phosphogluconolactonase [Pyrinomonadaceae bacterium]
MEAPKVTVLDGAEEVARAAAERFVELAQRAIDERGRFAVALSGGSTPRRAYELLAGDDYGDRVDWSKVHVFFGDERMVPPDDAESNYRMASEALLARVSIPPENVHRINGLGDALANARLYEDELRTFFNDDAWPSFDLVLLGMGDDGHTASLFPGTLALDEQAAWVAANWVEKFNVYRVTLTAPAINRAAHVIFLVTGANKAGPLGEVLKGRFNPRQLPSQLIKPLDGSLEWLVDEAAAAHL